MRGLGLILLAPASAILIACGARPNTTGSEAPLNDDLVLATDLPTDLDSAVYRRVLSSIRSCNVELDVDRVSREDAARAVQLTQQANEAELFGDQARAHALLEEAATLDPASGTTLYRLARSNEARQDTASAVQAYCRYLQLEPSERDATEARSRLLALWKPSAAQSAPAVTQRLAVSAPRAGGAPITRRATTRYADVRRVASRQRSLPMNIDSAENGSVAVESSASNGAVVDNGEGNSNVDTTGNSDVTAKGDGIASGERSDSVTVAAPPPVVASTPPMGGSPNESPRPSRRSTSAGTTRGAIAGAAAGAIAGAVMGGKLKNVLIGTAAGAVIGAVAGQSIGQGSN